MAAAIKRKKACGRAAALPATASAPRRHSTAAKKKKKMRAQLIDELAQLRLPLLRNQRFLADDLIDEHLSVRLRRECEQIDGLLAQLPSRGHAKAGQA